MSVCNLIGGDADGQSVARDKYCEHPGNAVGLREVIRWPEQSWDVVPDGNFLVPLES